MPCGCEAPTRDRWDLGRTDLGAFERRVLRETAKIPFGKTRTYGAIAESAGRPEAYRQVLSILLLNPIPLLIPCHRASRTSRASAATSPGRRGNAGCSISKARPPKRRSTAVTTAIRPRWSIRQGHLQFFSLFLRPELLPLDLQPKALKVPLGRVISRRRELRTRRK
ncbi:MAG: MGMT family protein [Nitrospiraceae bacterium]|nr:MGMT family protein [Nitrospiraceae bacterium]